MKNTNKANEIKINGNCKGVRCLTNGKYYHSVKEAAKAIGAYPSGVSTAIKNRGRCKGMEFSFESDTDWTIMKLASNLSETEITREEMNEFCAWKAEKEAERKAKEEHEAAVVKVKDKIARRKAICNRIDAQLQRAVASLMKAEEELAILEGNGKEVE